MIRPEIEQVFWLTWHQSPFLDPDCSANQRLPGTLERWEYYPLNRLYSGGTKEERRSFPLRCFFFTFSPSTQTNTNLVFKSFPPLHFFSLFWNITRYSTCLFRTAGFSEERRSRERFWSGRLASLETFPGCTRMKAAYGKFVFLTS